MSALEQAFKEFDSAFSTDTERLATFDTIIGMFKKVALAAFYGGYFEINGKTKIYPVDIEFYLYDERAGDEEEVQWMKDYNMYHYGEGVPYFPKEGSLHPHRSGVDVTFENEDKQYRASFLIRAYRNGTDHKKETHPTYLREEMFGEASFSGKGLNIVWIDAPEADSKEPIIKRRVNLNGKNKETDKKEWRFVKAE